MRKWWRYVPLQPAGLLLLALALSVALVLAPSEVDAVAYAAAVTSLAVIALCFLNTGVATAYLRWRMPKASSQALELQSGVEMRTGFRIPVLRRWPLLQVTLSWDTPAHVRVTLTGDEETITPLERGRAERIVRRVTVEDSFFLTRFSFSIEETLEVRVAPGLATANAAMVMSYGTGGDWSQHGGPPEGDLVEMRQYGPGDPMRRVLWKTFARSRRLLVRMPEPAFAPKPVNVAFFVAGANDEASAAVARSYLEGGLLGSDFLFAADGAPSPATNVTEAIEQIIDSARARDGGGTCLTAVGGKIDPSRLAASVVFAPAHAGEWIDRVLSFARYMPHASIVIGCDSDLVPAPEQSPMARAFLLPDEDPSRAVILSLRARLEQAGLRVQIVHRETGRVL